MTSIKIEDVSAYVRQNIGSFHEARLQSLKRLKLNTVLQKKNPYLFKAKNILGKYPFIPRKQFSNLI